MEDKIIKLLEGITIRLDEIEKKVDRNHDVTLSGLEKHEEDITVINDKLEDIMLIMIKRKGDTHIKNLLNGLYGSKVNKNE